MDIGKVVGEEEDTEGEKGKYYNIVMSPQLHFILSCHTKNLPYIFTTIYTLAIGTTGGNGLTKLKLNFTTKI